MTQSSSRVAVREGREAPEGDQNAYILTPKTGGPIKKISAERHFILETVQRTKKTHTRRHKIRLPLVRNILTGGRPPVDMYFS